MKRTIQNREHKHLSVVVGKLCCKGLEIPLGCCQQSLSVNFIAMESARYVLCSKMIFFLSEECCGGLEERCRNKSSVGAINNVQAVRERVWMSELLLTEKGVLLLLSFGLSAKEAFLNTWR